MGTALVAGDGILFRLEVADILEDEGYAVVEVANAARAPERLDTSVSLLVADVRMSGVMDALALAHAVNRLRPDVVVVSAQVNLAAGDLPEDAGFVGRLFLESRFRAAVSAAVAGTSRNVDD